MTRAGEPQSGRPSLDAMNTDPRHHSVLLENEHVRVLDTHVAAGERTAIHTHQWPAALYVISFSDFVRYDADGNILLDSRTLAVKPTDGGALWGPPLLAHCVHNVGTRELRVIAVELKPARTATAGSPGAASGSSM